MPLQRPDRPLNLAEIEDRLNKGDKDTFNADFAAEVKKALGGDANAIANVKACFQPTDKELASLGIKGNFETIRACTDVGGLIVVACKRAAPGIFPP